MREESRGSLRARAIALLPLALVLALFLARVPYLARAIPVSWDKDPRLSALLETAEYIASTQGDRQYVGAGWWANRDLEYILPRVLNFQDALNPQSVAGKEAALVRSEFWNWEKSPILAALERKPEAPALFSALPFEISILSQAQ